jgi:hypothetical protein
LGVEVDLIRDVLDKQLLDRHGVKFSKVDGLTAIWEPNQQPRVAFVELGAVVLARRVGARTERWISRLLSVRGSPEAVKSLGNASLISVWISRSPSIQKDLTLRVGGVG